MNKKYMQKRVNVSKLTHYKLPIFAWQGSKAWFKPNKGTFLSEINRYIPKELFDDFIINQNSNGEFNL